MMKTENYKTFWMLRECVANLFVARRELLVERIPSPVSTLGSHRLSTVRSNYSQMRLRDKVQHFAIFEKLVLLDFAVF